jgi:membrane fusion protein (multidrug efflux system)
VRLRTWRGTTAVSTTSRRSFPWARLILIVGVLAIAAYLLVPAYFYVSADALVEGNLVPVTPIYRARIDRLLVQCSDRVHAGQKLAMISNFIVQAQYEEQYQASVAQLNLSQIALDQGVDAARTEADADREKYNSAKATTIRLRQTYEAYDRAFRSGGIGRVELDNRREDWQAALALEASERETWQHAVEHVKRVDADNRTKLTSDRVASERQQSLVTRTGGEAILAPVGGYIVNCTDRPDNVVNPGTALFDIFEPDRAYVIAYFDPTSISRVRIGQSVEVNVAGLTRSIDGRVAAVYPNLSKLPPELTRFFWQHVQWSEYRPVRIALDRVPHDLRQQLYYDAQTRVRLRVRSDWRTPFALSGFPGWQR